ncbi:hypothetical protein TSAR_013144 [Trichomalopsis sarcophagae]|uniref:Uncharacterized protein n=1 Tax=Trichomalopsis sarcophagae TaxID=543379 RepID=A0A232FIV1_9HYME|nr:hypothetical protein TSAR_013144 [Trichomalopsis sarcophagae]
MVITCRLIDQLNTTHVSCKSVKNLSATLNTVFCSVHDLKSCLIILDYNKLFVKRSNIVVYSSLQLFTP